MRAVTGKAILAVAMMLALSACGGGNRSLMNLTSGDGPDEFAIVPPKALEMPDTLADLPAPTPGGANRSDPQPTSDAIVALGGQPSAAGGIPSGDGALYAHAARFGVESGIRDALAAEDLEFRSDNQGRVLERLFNVNVYYRAYRKQSLDQEAELARWRKAGVKTPSAPPSAEAQDAWQDQ
ncbi:MAG: pyruvate/2-oxoglutarate dehydrogenase complex, dihydrolipoamide acyltransferase (E2) component [Rhodobacterales bacterium 32-66-7]|nr:MAG: pyruvate/2-oxoglutarate dehydrogenase complex, dihydrolipoamide acyltransferase (E2) component [Rhodobacterales bacterium 12-65-15]OYX24110.1 MAG: pyruvate/2-oxoglutarate dehydrogenase complex, dihydrolipoamide acyltransferase (E2) component [Rhodobacterales bacterium 32-66-7]